MYTFIFAWLQAHSDSDKNDKAQEGPIGKHRSIKCVHGIVLLIVLGRCGYHSFHRRWGAGV